MGRLVLWDDTNCYPEDEYWDKFLKENYPKKELETMSEEEKQDIIYEELEKSLSNLRADLNKEVTNDIIVIASLGLWDGRRSGYKILGNNLKECFFSSDGDEFTKWEINEKKDLVSTNIRHDGNNYLLYRVFKKNISQKKKEKFLQTILDNEVTEMDIKEHTKSLYPFIKKVYV